MMSDLSEVLSGEQVRCILHISKRKCAWMLNNGFIKCQNNGKRSRKYIVLKEDLLKYIEDSQKHPERYATPYAEFSSAKYISKTAGSTYAKRDFLPLCRKDSEYGLKLNLNPFQMHSPCRRS